MTPDYGEAILHVCDALKHLNRALTAVIFGCVLNAVGNIFLLCWVKSLKERIYELEHPTPDLRTYEDFKQCQ